MKNVFKIIKIIMKIQEKNIKMIKIIIKLQEKKRK